MDLAAPRTAIELVVVGFELVSPAVITLGSVVA